MSHLSSLLAYDYLGLIIDNNVDFCIRPEVVAVTRMLLCVPVPNAPFYLAKKVEATLLGQVSEIADQICNGMLITSAAVLLKNRDGLSGPSDVVRSVDHYSPQQYNRSTANIRWK